MLGVIRELIIYATVVIAVVGVIVGISYVMSPGEERAKAAHRGEQFGLRFILLVLAISLIVLMVCLL
jgi:hypothetical protein